MADTLVGNIENELGERIEQVEVIADSDASIASFKKYSSQEGLLLFPI